MQQIVVEREEDGKAAISYLKRRDGGRCTFLPFPPSAPASFGTLAAGERGFVGMGDKLVEFDPRYQRVFSNLLGGWWWPRTWTPPSPWPGNTT